MAPDVRIFDLAQRLLDCANDRLAETDGGAIDDGNACVITGAIAWDNCLCGSLNVAITSGFPSSNFPTPSANTTQQFGAGRCGQPILVFNLTITVLRCVPVSDEQGNPPPCEALAASALGAVQDAWAVQAGVLCCLQDMLREKDPVTNASVITAFAAQGQDFLGPQGACGGSAMTVQVGLLNRCPCSDD